MKANRWIDAGLIFLAIIISYLFSMTNSRINNMEMDALLNFYFPSFLGVPLLVLFLIFTVAFKTAYARARWPIVAVISLLIILLGVWLHYI
jgi:hypothetical protein